MKQLKVLSLTLSLLVSNFIYSMEGGGASAPETFQNGSLVMLHSLNATRFNEQTATVIRREETGRYIVQLDSDQSKKKIKPENLRSLTSSEADRHRKAKFGQQILTGFESMLESMFDSSAMAKVAESFASNLGGELGGQARNNIGESEEFKANMENAKALVRSAFRDGKKKIFEGLFRQQFPSGVVPSDRKGMSSCKVEQFLSSCTAVDASEEKTNCTICLDELESTGSKLPCGHKFHKNCIGQWLQRASTCPLCRTVFRK